MSASDASPVTDSPPAETREYTDWADKEAFDAIVGIRFPTEEALLHVKDDIANRFRELAAQRDHEVWMHAGCLSIAENTPGWRDASRDGWSLAMQAVAKLQDKVAELEQKASHTEGASSPKPEPATTPEDVLEKAHDAAWPFLKDLECVDRDLRWGVTGTTTRPAIKAALAAVNVPSLLEKTAELETTLVKARETIGLLRSIALSGEQYTPTAQSVTEDTLNAISAALPKQERS